MKKVIQSIILSTLLIGLGGCQIKTEDNTHKDSLSVEILATNDSDSFYGMPITLTPKVKGEYNKELEYHWILENDDDFEGFIVPDKGPQKEIINLGEPVELGLFAKVEWVEGTIKEFKVKLQVEYKETSDIIATNEIIVVNKEGVYSIK